MFKKFLIQEHHFWSIPGKKDLLIFHNASSGGIYALCSTKKVTIFYNQQKRSFSNFDKLDRFLKQIAEDQKFKMILGYFRLRERASLPDSLGRKRKQNQIIVH